MFRRIAPLRLCLLFRRQLESHLSFVCQRAGPRRKEGPLPLAETARSLRKKWQTNRPRPPQLQAPTAIEKISQTEGFPFQTVARSVRNPMGRASLPFCPPDQFWSLVIFQCWELEHDRMALYLGCEVKLEALNVAPGCIHLRLWREFPILWVGASSKLQRCSVPPSASGAMAPGALG